MLTAFVWIPVSPLRQTTDKPYHDKENLIIQDRKTCKSKVKEEKKEVLGLSRRVVTIKALLLVLWGNKLKDNLNRLKNGLYIHLFSNLSYFCFYKRNTERFSGFLV